MIASNIVSGVLSGLLVLCIKRFLEYRREEGGTLTADWDQFISEQDGEPAKHDIVHCRDNGSKLHGWIERITPPDQSSKRWNFQGQRRGQLVFLTFCTESREINPGSYGTIQLYMSRENEFCGYYVKLIVDADQSSFTGELKQFSLVWKLRGRG